MFLGFLGFQIPLRKGSVLFRGFIEFLVERGFGFRLLFLRSFNLFGWSFGGS